MGVHVHLQVTMAMKNDNQDLEDIRRYSQGSPGIIYLSMGRSPLPGASISHTNPVSQPFPLSFPYLSYLFLFLLSAFILFLF